MAPSVLYIYRCVENVEDQLIAALLRKFHCFVCSVGRWYAALLAIKSRQVQLLGINCCLAFLLF